MTAVTSFATPLAAATRRYMAVTHADAASEASAAPADQAEALRAFRADLEGRGAFLGMEGFEPSRKGKRLRAEDGKRKVVVLDGPFAETKELIGGFVIVETASIEDAVPWARKYLEQVDTEEVDIRGLPEA